MSVPLPSDLREQVSRALAEDVGPGDLTAGLIGESAHGTARIVNREAAVLAGTAWVDEVFRQVDDRITTEWLFDDGARLEPDTEICRLHGPARGLLTGERTALNFLQTLSGTATEASRYAEAVAGTDTVILDTRKTLPGLRTAQKYAVRCGGCRNHRTGLYDGILIKENHIMAAGSIGAAVGAARGSAGDRPVEVEVESLEEAGEALTAGADILLLDNFSLDDMRETVRRTAGRAKLEASGGVELEDLRAIAETGVDFISVGAMTKNVRALDLSMRFHFDD